MVRRHLNRIFDMMVLGYAAEEPIHKDVRGIAETIHYNSCGTEDFRTDEEVVAYARKTKAWCLAAYEGLNYRRKRLQPGTDDFMGLFKEDKGSRKEPRSRRVTGVESAERWLGDLRFPVFLSAPHENLIVQWTSLTHPTPLLLSMPRSLLYSL